ncbi:MAG TPA: ATP-grasp domain-containing protein [Pyrinomonadaceae bacterium]|nr:ATP-grasp domain-containing protein [Pyrinomonadaceae bacterium]
MAEPQSRALNVVCLASYFKGAEFIRECRQQGARTFLLTRERTLREDWPRECIEAIIAAPNDASGELFQHIATQAARTFPVDRIVALEEYDVRAAAMLREHLSVAGMSSSRARLFRDKLAMRVRAEEAGLLVPPFVHVHNYEAIRDYMNRVPPPWVLKPRSDVSAIGIKKLSESEPVWRAIDALDARPALDERSSFYLLERFIAGDVFHVDSLVENKKVVFAWASQYGRPPMEVAHQGGAFISHTVEHDSEDERSLFEINRQLLKSLGLERGAAHAEFIKGATDGRFYFLEVAARVGGAYTSENVEAASGVNLWREWAKIELAGGRCPVKTKPSRREYSGIVLSLARQEYPDTDAYTDAEIAYRVNKKYHVGLVVRSPRQERVRELLDAYARRFAADFIAVAPPLERPH